MTEAVIDTTGFDDVLPVEGDVVTVGGDGVYDMNTFRGRRDWVARSPDRRNVEFSHKHQWFVPTENAKCQDMPDGCSSPTCAVNWNCVYRWFDASGVLLYVGITDRGSHRDREHAKYSKWWPLVHRGTTDWFTRRELAREAESVAIREECPVFNVTGRTLDEGRRLQAAYQPTYVSAQSDLEVSVTPEMAPQAHVYLSARVPKALRTDLQHQAVRESRPVAHLVQDAIRVYLEQAKANS